MARSLVLALVGLFVALPAPVHVAARQADGVAVLLLRLGQAIRSGSPDGYTPLLSATADRAEASAFADSVIRPGVTRAVVRELDRTPLEGTPPGDRFRLTAEAFVETGRSAQLYTWVLEVRRASRPGGSADPGAWTISAQRTVGTLPAIYRLQLDEQRQLSGRQLVITDEDTQITIPQADVFVADAEGEPTALVVLGKGRMHVAPAQPAERGQVKVFSGSETLDTPVDALFVRVPPGELERHVSGTLEPRPVEARQLSRANDIFNDEVRLSYGLDLGDFSRDTWSMLPSSGDFLAEISTRKYGMLTYARNSHDAEDVSLFQRERRRNISVYTSAARLASRGRFYSDDDGLDYRAASYDIDASFEPDRNSVAGRTRLRLQVLAPSVSTLTLRLADSLAVSSVTSPEYGRLLAVRIRGQNSVVVRLPAPVSQGSGITLDVAYAGTVAPQPASAEALPQLQVSRQPTREVRLEESFLYSNEIFWYARAPGSGYSTATLRLRVPPNYSCVASGKLVEPASAAAGKEDDERGRFTFVASRPARYFACLITPLVEGASRVLKVRKASSREGEADGTASLNLEVMTNPRLRSLARPLADTAGDILEFYASIIGDSPYPDVTVAAVEWNFPGGHSPAYLAILNQQLPGRTTTSYSNDPAFFDGFPEFYLAHELAHQWWGQAVGWKNYHEQWLSEGLAQYFAALYAEKLHGPGTFASILRRFRQWSMDTTGQGPIYLGYRVGHLKGDSRVFRAVVYDKSAAVLHMLRRMVGDDAFFRGLRRYYTTWRFKKAGSDDLRQAMQAESGLDLERFFERWVYGDSEPAVSFGATVEGGPQGREALVRFDQRGEVFDIPVTVTVDYADRPSVDVLVKITGRHTEARIPLAGRFKKIEVNRDGAALGVFTESRSTKG